MSVSVIHSLLALAGISFILNLVSLNHSVKQVLLVKPLLSLQLLLEQPGPDDQFLLSSSSDRETRVRWWRSITKVGDILLNFVLTHCQQHVLWHIMLGMCMNRAVNLAAVFVIRSSFRRSWKRKRCRSRTGIGILGGMKIENNIWIMWRVHEVKRIKSEPAAWC